MEGARLDDEVRVLDEGMDEVNVSEWMYGGIVMR